MYCTSILIVKADIKTFRNVASDGVVKKTTKITVRDALARPGNINNITQ